MPPQKKTQEKQEEKIEVPPKEGIDLNAEEVLLPEDIGRIKFGSKEIVLKPMSLKTALKVGRFITKNFGRAFNSESFKAAKADPLMTEIEVWIGVANEFLISLEEEEIIGLLCDITLEDEQFIKENFSLAGMAGVVRALVLTEDFEQIFLEVKRMRAGRTTTA